jgi:hypothetical protein
VGPLAVGLAAVGPPAADLAAADLAVAGLAAAALVAAAPPAAAPPAADPPAADLAAAGLAGVAPAAAASTTAAARAGSHQALAVLAPKPSLPTQVLISDCPLTRIILATMPLLVCKGTNSRSPPVTLTLRLRQIMDSLLEAAVALCYLLMRETLQHQ